MEKHFKPPKIKQLIEAFSFSELRKLIAEMDIEYFALCYFPKYFDRQFGQFHRELFAELKHMLSNTGLITAFGLPREHGKSTISSFLFPLYATLNGRLMKLVFVTSYKEYAPAAFDVHAYDYILKPVEQDRLHKIVQRVLSEYH
jgi:hypothetical protein